MSEERGHAARKRTLTFVSCISDDELLNSNLLASPCLAPGSPHNVILAKNARSGADGLNLGIRRARKQFHCLRPSGRFPPGRLGRASNQPDRIG
jgi:hypothetical protein